MARKYTPFNGPGGESFTTDAERMDAASAHQQAAIEAMRRAGQPQEAAPQAQGYQYNPAEFNDWQNRQREMTENKQRLLGTAGDQDRQTIQTGDVGQNYRMETQMKPSLMGQTRADSQYAEGKPLRDFKTQYAMKALQGLDSGDMVGDAVGGQPSSQNRLGEQIVRSMFGVGEDPDIAYNRATKQRITEAMTNKGFEMASSPDPRIRNQGAAILKQQGVNFPQGGIVGAGGDPQQTAQYLTSPQTQVKMKQLLAVIQRGMGSMRPEIAGQDIQTAIQEMAAEAAQMGADPKEVSAMLLQKVEEQIPETSIWTDPIRTTLGLGGALFDTSENALRKSLGF